ncbi:MAG: hypothetical protein IJN50_07550 [Clostridia bacterium]|nr:hypothetical protein [Clostridia bacterium]
MIDKRLLTNKTRNTFIIALAIFVILLIAGFIMLKYDVQGETNLPFNLSKINIVSTAKEETVKNEEDKWQMNILQNNDIYFYIEKNNDYRKDVVIEKVIFDNFNIIEENNIGEVKVYKPSEDESDVYKYKEEYEVSSVEYKGSLVTNNKFLEINNQGGIVEFSIANINLGSYPIDQEQTLSADGSLLNLINANYDDLKFSIAFDMTIVVENENTYKAQIILDLPVGDITQEGVSTQEDNELEDIVFKRI